MGYVYVKAIVGHPKGIKKKEINLLADRGAGYTVLPPRLVQELELTAVGETEVILADKRKVIVERAPLYIKILDRETIILAMVLDSPEPLLGAFTLEELGLAIDPTTGEIKPSRSFSIMA